MHSIEPWTTLIQKLQRSNVTCAFGASADKADDGEGSGAAVEPVCEGAGGAAGAGRGPPAAARGRGAHAGTRAARTASPLHQVRSMCLLTSQHPEWELLRKCALLKARRCIVTEGAPDNWWRHQCTTQSGSSGLLVLYAESPCRPAHKGGTQIAFPSCSMFYSCYVCHRAALSIF